MKQQMFKVFDENRELSVNKLISEGWRVVSFSSSEVSGVSWLFVLFEKDEE